MTFRFQASLFLLLLPLIPLLISLLRWRAGRQSPVAGLRYADTALAQVAAHSWRTRLLWLPNALRWLALALLVIGLARPQRGDERQVVNGEGVDIALVLDISSSMETNDFFPSNRLEAAKDVIEAFVGERPFDRLGLVVFASDAFVQSPPTTDHDMLTRQVDMVESARIMQLEDGTAIGMGVATAVNMLKDSAVQSRVIILLTDGVNNAGQIDPLTAAEAARALGIKVYTIGAGRVGSFFSDDQNRLDEATLQQIANITGALYFRAEDRNGLAQVYDEINALERSDIEIQVFTRYEELMGWLVLPGLLLLLLEFGLRQTVLRVLP